MNKWLWNFVTIILLILIVANFIQINSFNAFVDLKASELRFQFNNENREEFSIAEFDDGTNIVASDNSDRALIGAALNEISISSDSASLKFESIGEDKVELCLSPDDFTLSTETDGQFDEVFLKLSGGRELCLELDLSRPFLVFPEIIAVDSHRDSSGILSYPDLSGSLRVSNTGKTLQLISGMTVRLTVGPDAQGEAEEKIEATKVHFANGDFGIHSWKRVSVEMTEGEELEKFSFTPLDVLRKIMEDNGLWYTVMLVTGAVITLRKVLLLR